MPQTNVATAAVCRAHGESLVVEAITVAAPGPDEVRVKIEVCAVCHSDITYAAGGWGGNLPAIYGHEAAGVIESVGEYVISVEVGQRVIVGLLRNCGWCYHCLRGEDWLCIGEFTDPTPFANATGEPIIRGLRTGAFASQTVVHHSQVVPMPNDVPLEAACLLACGVLTGFGSVTNTAQMPAGSTAAVIGVGGVGLSAVQGTVHAGASIRIAVDLVDAKLDSALDFGATHTINSKSSDAVADARTITGGIGPDYVFVCAGVKQAIELGIEMVRAGGTVVLVGMPPSGVMLETEATELADASLTIRGSKMGSGGMATDVPHLIDLYRSGTLKVDEMVSNIYPLEQINEAMDEVVSGKVIRNLIRFDQ